MAHELHNIVFDLETSTTETQNPDILHNSTKPFIFSSHAKVQWIPHFLSKNPFSS